MSGKRPKDSCRQLAQQDSLGGLLSRIDGLVNSEEIAGLLKSRAAWNHQGKSDANLLIQYLGSRLVEVERENFQLRKAQKELQETLRLYTSVDIGDYQKAKDLLQKTEEKYKNLVETISHGIQEVDTDGRIIFANKSLHSIYGYADGELVGREIFDFMALDKDRQKIRDYMAALRQGQILPIPYECKSLTKAGQAINVSVHWNYKRGENGSVTGFILIVTDVTARKKVEESLRESEEKFRRTFDQSPIGAAIVALDFRYLRVNGQFCRITGYSEQELLSKTIADITHPDDREEDRTQIAILSQCKAEQCQTDKRYIRKDGRIVWARVYTRIVRDGAGKPLYYLPLIEDITDRKHAEEELLFKNTLLEAESETSTDGILVVDDNRRIISHNKRFMRMWHIPQRLINAADDQEVINYVLCQLEDPETFLEQVNYLYAHKNAKSNDLIHFKDGRIFARYSAALIGSNGTHYGRIWYYRDVTTQKRAEQKILRLNEELEHRVAERTARLARDHRRLIQEIEDRKCLEREIIDISESEKRRFGQELHDSVGQQLTGIAFMTKALAQDIAERLPREADSADEIARLLNQALEKTRKLARGLHPVDLNAHNLGAALHELAANTEHFYGVRCVCRCDSVIPVEDCAVAIHIYRIVQEAITNAMKHGKAKNVLVKLTSFGGKSILTVQNDGEDFPEVMTRSTGMGLQIMSHRVEMIDGSLDIRRGEGGGTLVTCVLPNKAQQQGSGATG